MEVDEDGNSRYLVSWEGYYSDQDTWEYAVNIDREALVAYRKRVAAKRERRGSTSRRRGRRSSSTSRSN